MGSIFISPRMSSYTPGSVLGSISCPKSLFSQPKLCPGDRFWQKLLPETLHHCISFYCCLHGTLQQACYNTSLQLSFTTHIYQRACNSELETLANRSHLHISRHTIVCVCVCVHITQQQSHSYSQGVDCHMSRMVASRTNT